MPRKKKTDEEEEGKIEALRNEVSGVLKNQKIFGTQEAKLPSVQKTEEFSSKTVGFSKEKAEKKTETKKKKTVDLLIPVEDYIKYSSYLGTKVITAHMQKYVYRRRADGLAIFNTTLTDQKLRAAISLLSQYKPEDIVICCKRRAGWNSLELLSKLTGIRVFTKKYPAGIITNPNLAEFFEPKLMFIIDPWLDKNPLIDAGHINIPVISICDTNNITSYADFIIPANNKSNKSIGLLFWIIAREYCKARGIEVKMPSIEDFIGPDVI